MKRNLFLIATAIILLLSFNSCTKNNLDLDKTLNFSTLTVEQQKQSIEKAGIDFVDKMEAVKETKAMDAMKQFSANSDGSISFVKPIQNLRRNLLTNNVKSMEIFSQQMKVASSVGDSIWGEWTWNPSKQDFDFKAVKTTTALFLFPADSTSTKNNAELKITYVESNVVAPDTDPVEYMPSSISVVLKVDNAQALKADFTGTYETDGTPTSVKQTLVIDKYSWSAELTDNKTDVSAKYSFKYNNETLIKLELAAAGSLTAKELQESSNPQDVLTSGVMYFQIMNIAFLGGIKDFTAFADEMDGIKDTNNRAYADSQVATINKYLKMYGYYVDKNQKFADVEFYVVETTDSYVDYSVYPYQTITTTDYSFQPRFVLSDGSKVDIQTYMETGFEDLITKVENF